MIRRRTIIAGIGGAAVSLPFAARAQQTLPVVGILGSASPENREVAANLAAFRQGLSEAGFVEGQNVTIEYRWAYNEPQQLPSLAAELVAGKVNVIVIEGGTPTAMAARNATSTIPIVFHAADAVADGLVGNIARPDGNLTGVSLFGPEGLAKQYQLCTEMLPAAKAIGLLVFPKMLIGDYAIGAIEAATRQRGVQLLVFDADADIEVDVAFARLEERRGGVVVRAHVSHAATVIGLAARHRVPAVYNQRAFVTAGGLLSYGPSIPAAYVVKGRYAGRILKGAKPSELPVQQATKLDLVVNLKTATALGLAVPPSIMARADEVME